MLLSKQTLRRILGILWLIDGLFQLQPHMFTMDLINGVMAPIVQSQPGPVAVNLQWIVAVATQHIVLLNLIVTIVQIALGFLLIIGYRVRETVIASVFWSLIVWYGGEGMNMLFTGQASILTGAPGAVLLYPLLGFLVYPRKTSSQTASEDTVLSQVHFHRIMAGFWIFAAILQLQPYWWQPGQISQTLSDMIGQGGLNSLLIDPILKELSMLTASIEVPLNILLIVCFLVLGIGLAISREERLRPFLIASLVASLLIWWVAEGLGMVFTGMTTDFNSGLLLIVMTLACWPKTTLFRTSQDRGISEAKVMLQEKS